jgi:hypothetical protein
VGFGWGGGWMFRFRHTIYPGHSSESGQSAGTAHQNAARSLLLSSCRPRSCTRMQPCFLDAHRPGGRGKGQSQGRWKQKKQGHRAEIRQDARCQRVSHSKTRRLNSKSASAAASEMALSAKQISAAKAPVATRRSVSRVVVCKAVKATNEAEMVSGLARMGPPGRGECFLTEADVDPGSSSSSSSIGPPLSNPNESPSLICSNTASPCCPRHARGRRCPRLWRGPLSRCLR